MFEIGDKVLLVDDNWPTTPVVMFANYPVKDVVYVVRELVEHKSNPGIVFLRFVGHFGGNHPTLQMEFGFNQVRFRKLSDIQQENREKRRRKGKVIVRRKIGETSDGYWILSDS